MKSIKVNKTNIIKLLDMPGIAGRESKVSEFISEKLSALGFDIDYDNLGSLIATKKSEIEDAKTILFDAHMDEVGFMITHITDNGLLKFEEHGGIDKKLLLGQRVKIWNKDYSKATIGVISYSKKLSSVPNIEDMFIDVGATTREEIEEKNDIKVGAGVTFAEMAVSQGNIFIAKSGDDRLGVAMLLDLAEHIQKKKLKYNLVLAFSVQEEVGIRGARTTAYKVKPDVAITVDTSPAKDFPVSTQEGDIGKGTFIRHKDALHITNENVVSYIEELMKDNKIKHQDYFSDGGTNAYAYSLTESGRKIIPAGMLVRHIHTGSLIFDLRDYKETLKFLVAIAEDFNVQKKLNSFLK